MGSCTEQGGCLYNLLQLIRWLPCVFVAAVLGWAYYAYIIQLCINTVTNDIQRVLYMIGFHILLFMFAWSYVATVFAKIRHPPQLFYIPRDVVEDLSHAGEDDQRCSNVLQRYAAREKLPIRMRGYEGGIRYCPKCTCLKPDRSHHCSMCGQCVLKFDHHCPWVNTCVNFHNYKFFLQFLGYGLLLCLFGFLTDLPFFILFWKNEIHADRSIVVGKFHMLFLFFVSGMFALSLGCLFFYHLWLTAKNRTTIESFRAPVLSGGPDKHAFNMGLSSNYKQVFGVRPLLWFLPIYSSVGDGVDYDSAGVPCSFPDMELGWTPPYSSDSVRGYGSSSTPAAVPPPSSIPHSSNPQSIHPVSTTTSSDIDDVIIRRPPTLPQIGDGVSFGRVLPSDTRYSLLATTSDSEDEMEIAIV